MLETVLALSLPRVVDPAVLAVRSTHATAGGNQTVESECAVVSTSEITCESLATDPDRNVTLEVARNGQDFVPLATEVRSTRAPRLCERATALFFALAHSIRRLPRVSSVLLCRCRWLWMRRQKPPTTPLWCP